MSIWGKIIGGTAGLVIGGPLGALVGSALGHAADVYNTDTLVRPGEDATQKVAFTIGVIALGAKMAKADGAVTCDEVEAFHRVFRTPPEERRNVQRLWDLAKRDTAGYESYARQLGRLLADRPAVLEEVLDSLFHIADADGHIGDPEMDYLRSVSDLFGLPREAYERVRSSYRGPSFCEPYTVLGVDCMAGDDAIREAYRRLARENHPDRLVAQGLPEELMALANEKMATINAAYDRIRKERSLA
ncbi:MAG TPA: TerB family tellurite resistance protein [Alphaproteobacteria bacterium]|nr:TerB family tellurite resistance protein [Alphaproteobacteria bacterium]